MPVQENNAIHTVKIAILDYLVENKLTAEQGNYRAQLEQELRSNRSLLHLYEKLPVSMRSELRGRVMRPSVSGGQYVDGVWHPTDAPDWKRILDNLDARINVMIPNV